MNKTFALIDKIFTIIIVGVLICITVNAVILIPLCMINFSNYVSQTVTNIVGYGVFALSFVVAIYSTKDFIK